MSADEVPFLSDILRTANSLETLGNTWYKACQAWDDFPRQVTLLRENSDFWQHQLKQFGMDLKAPGDRIVSPLHEVQNLLNDETAKLKKKKSKQTVFVRLIRKLTIKPAFPSSLGQGVAKLAKAFDDDVLDTLKLERASKENLCPKMWNLDFQEDDRYVSLDETEATVCTALERFGPGLVLLYGGVGTGKSTLARYLALQVHAYASRTNAISNQRSLSDSGNRRSRLHGFDWAVFLECSVGCDLEAKRREVRACMGLDTCGVEEILAEYKGTNERDSVSQLRQSVDADYKAERQSTSRASTRAKSDCKDIPNLTDKKLLIILDDVRNAEFLQGIVNLCGKNLNWKLLVTTVTGDLVQGLNLTQTHLSAISMEFIKQDDARNILISNIPCSAFNKSKSAVRDLQAILNDIIEKTGANPLAMASIAGTIDENKYEEKEVWDNAADNISWLLGTNNTAAIHQKKYSKSFWEALQEIFDDLEHGARSLLVLTAVCKGPSTRESVIEFFWRALFPSSSRSFFKKARRQLEARQLIKMTGADTNLGLSGPKEMRWSIQILVQRFISERRRDDKTSLLTMMEAAMNKVVDSLSHDDHDVQEQGVQFLTNLATGTHAMKLKVAKSRYVFKMTIKALNKESSGNIQVLVASVFAIWAEGDDDMRMRIISIPNALDELVKAMMAKVRTSQYSDSFPEEYTIVGGQTHAPNDLQRQAARVLANLAEGDDYTKWRIIVFPGLLKTLVSGMAGRQNPVDVQQHIAWALINLAKGSHELKLGMVEFPGLLEALANAMTKQCNYAEHAAQVLANLAEGGQEIKKELVNFPRILEELINGMIEYHTGFQEQATFALANLADGEDATKLKILRVPGAVENLVSILKEAESRSVQFNATRTLANLARGDCEAKTRIVEHNGAFEQLVKAMSKEGDSHIHLNAIMALANLIAFDSEGNQALAIKSRMVRSGKAIVTLGLGLDNDSNPDIQVQSRRALDNLIASSK